jgi:spore coat protein U-like protein
MQVKKSLLTATLFSVASLVTISSATAADTATGNFNVGLTIESSCKLTEDSASDIDLTSATDGVVKKGNSDISVACSVGTPYTIGFIAGNDGGAGGIGVLKGLKEGSVTIGYKLTQDLEGAAAWGNTAITNTVAGTGTGKLNAISHPVYVTTTTTTDVIPDTYSDTVDVTVTY